MRNSYGKKKKKLSSWYDQLITILMVVWLKKIPTENKISDSPGKRFQEMSEEKVNDKKI